MAPLLPMRLLARLIFGSFYGTIGMGLAYATLSPRLISGTDPQLWQGIIFRTFEYR